MIFPRLVAELGPTRIRAWRWLAGGHWELWYVDAPVSSDVWHRVERCSRVTGSRPTAICRGTPTCETYRLGA